MAADDGDGPENPDPSLGPEEPVEGIEPELSQEPIQPAVPVVEAHGLTHKITEVRRFRLLRRARPPIRALTDVSFIIEPAEAVGCLGVKGSGKTTLLEILTGVRNPTDGTIHTFGLPPVPARDELASRVGAVFADRPWLWPDLSLTESLRVLASIHGLPERQWLPRSNDLVERLDLASSLDIPVIQLSPGRRRCAEVAAALLPEPEFIVFDEPTLDLDVRSKDMLRSLLRHEHRVYGRTVLVSSSRLGDIEQFCDRLLVIDHGRLGYDGDIGGLISRAGGQRVLVVDVIEPGRLLDDVPGTSLFAVEGGGLRQRLSFTPGEVSTASVLAEVTARAGIRDLTLEDPRLEDVVRRLRFNPESASGS